MSMYIQKMDESMDKIDWDTLYKDCPKTNQTHASTVMWSILFTNHSSFYTILLLRVYNIR